MNKSTDNSKSSESRAFEGTSRLRRTAKTSRAFIVESLVLFAFLVAMLAIVSQLLFSSAATAAAASNLEQAIFLSSNAAEKFSMDPEGAMHGKYDIKEGNLLLTVNVDSEDTSSNDHVIGHLYTANIIVMSSDEIDEIYSVRTSRYVSIDDGENRKAITDEPGDVPQVEENTADMENSGEINATNNAIDVIEEESVLADDPNAPVPAIIEGEVR